MPKVKLLNLDDLRSLITFAKANNIPKIKCGDFECEIAPRDVTKTEIDALHKRIAQMEAVTQRLCLQVEAKMQHQTNTKPFSQRIDLQKKTQNQ